jgi:hypothetical protein
LNDFFQGIKLLKEFQVTLFVSAERNTDAVISSVHLCTGAFQSAEPSCRALNSAASVVDAVPSSVD